MPGNDDRSFASVLEDIVNNIQGIIRSEVRLAKAEIQEEAGKAGKAGRLLGVGAVLAFYATGFLFLTCVYALETAVDPWLAGLIVTLVVGIGAAVLITAGLKRMKRVDPLPEKTIQTVKENFEWAKNQTK